ncbi:hypothetical protein [Metamycoplasma buccale]|uniref:hypothetical protein n=1 Tax=Metamycoplasma buccale TaxID=55602 RepID=UPI00398F3A97
MKNNKLKSNILNFIGFLAVFAFLAIGIILVLAGAKIFGKINQASAITCYVFGAIFLFIFVFIIAKIIAIAASENVYKKNALNVDEIYKNYSLTEEQQNQAKLFENATNEDKAARDIYFSYLVEFQRKSFKRDDIQFNDVQVKLNIEKFILDVKQEFGYFDVYLAIDFTKTTTRKLVWKGEYKKYKAYFDNIRNLIKFTNDIILHPENNV